MYKTFTEEDLKQVWEDLSKKHLPHQMHVQTGIEGSYLYNLIMRKQLCKNIIKQCLIDQELSIDYHNSLMKMIDSEDVENLVIAETIIQNLIKTNFNVSHI